MGWSANGSGTHVAWKELLRIRRRVLQLSLWRKSRLLVAMADARSLLGLVLFSDPRAADFAGCS